MVEGNFTLTPDMIWDGKYRKQTPEEIAAWIKRHKEWSERQAEVNKIEPLPDDFIEYCKGRK
jgi:hypothetical protein